MKELHGKVAVITGAGSNIGQTLSVELAKLGVKLALVDINPDGLDETRWLISDFHDQLQLYTTDVSDRSAVNRMASNVLGEFGAVDIVINNAILYFEKMPFTKFPIENIEAMLQTNIMGPVYVTQAFLPTLLDRPEGSIVNFASRAALIPNYGDIPYVISKHGIVGFTEGLWIELYDTKVVPLLVYPGYILDVKKYPEKLIKDINNFVPQEKMASLIINSIQRNKRVLYTGRRTKLNYWVRTLFTDYMAIFGKRFTRGKRG
jgi:butyryl-CoA dehydrogenase